ncbi:hypothetical protein POTOM_030912 [Populus tomentosa]|uniref:Retrotransposon gag domain-containing protein n=1 Tax=Populus tomentosa TaxID=118781 RepID=A0A8X8CR68_POPTO|nr:hypothetical protein POTOM_030912 [Populus tomentosa]
MGEREPQSFQIKMDLPTFNGQLQIEGFLDWLTVVERFFDYMEIPKDKKVKLVVYRLMEGASAWWEQLQLTQMRQRKGMVQTWSKMRRLLHYRLSSHNNLLEIDAQEVARCIGGFRLNIQDRVLMHTIYFLTEAINLATKAETLLDSTRATCVARIPVESMHAASHKGKFPLNPPPSISNFSKGLSSSKMQMTTTRVVPPEAPRNPYSKPTSDKYYRLCQLMKLWRTHSMKHPQDASLCPQGILVFVECR